MEDERDRLGEAFLDDRLCRLAPWLSSAAGGRRIAFFISDMLPSPPPRSSRALIGIATFATVAHRILRYTDGHAETMTPAIPPTVPARLEPSATKAGV
jgi:hypothetical protein